VFWILEVILCARSSLRVKSLEPIFLILLALLVAWLSAFRQSFVLTILTTKIRPSKPQVREEYMARFMHIFSINKVPRVVL
jgi:hypothetical protein